MDKIYRALTKGTRLPFEILANAYGSVSAFWDHWWDQVDFSILSRPYTILESDPILRPTIEKDTVDTVSWNEMFYPFLKVRLEKEILPSGVLIRRNDYRAMVVEHLIDGLKETETSDSKVAVFVGGGYGAGKTTTLSTLAKYGKLPFDKENLLGVDYCKLFIPEFDRIKMVADGRASEVCQEEARLISEHLFLKAIGTGKSFAWDSSMSNMSSTLEKVQAAKAAGYELWLIGVWTPLHVSVPRAMKRAFEIRRFAHPKHLEPSTRGFARNFEVYVEHFDRVELYSNGNEPCEGEDPEPRLIAEKDPVDSVLAIDDENITQQFLKFGKKP